MPPGGVGASGASQKLGGTGASNQEGPLVSVGIPLGPETSSALLVEISNGLKG